MTIPVHMPGELVVDSVGFDDSAAPASGASKRPSPAAPFQSSQPLACEKKPPPVQETVLYHP
jgi:hypothetical protein